MEGCFMFQLGVGGGGGGFQMGGGFIFKWGVASHEVGISFDGGGGGGSKKVVG